MLVLTSECKSAPVQYSYKFRYYLAPLQCLSSKLSRKQNKTILMLCKPLFIVHARVKGLFKVILQYENEAPQLEKWAWHVHNEIV